MPQSAGALKRPFRGEHASWRWTSATTLTTLALAAKLKDWQLTGDDVALVIGGPDGLDPAFRQAAHERIRLSNLTLATRICTGLAD